MSGRRACRACFENGCRTDGTCCYGWVRFPNASNVDDDGERTKHAECHAYSRQQAWNAMMARLYADEGRSVRTPAKPQSTCPLPPCASWLSKAWKDRTVAKAYHALRAVVPAVRVRVEDMHKPRVRIVPNMVQVKYSYAVDKAQDGWTLERIAPARKRSRKAVRA